MNSKYKFPCGVLLSLALSLLVGCGGGGGGGPTTPPQETIRNFSDYQAATAVIGASDKITSGTFLGQHLAGNPAIGPDGHLYLPSNDRIYVYKNVPSADATLASALFVVSDAGDAGLMNGLQTIIFSGQKMIASDWTHNRVLIWDPAPTSDSATWTPKFVVGQRSVAPSNNSSGCTADALFSAESVNVIAGNLVIADSGNNRILIYEGIPSTNGASPKIVLGDTDACGNFQTAAAPTASTLNYPTDVAYDGTHFIVADYGNNRLLIWTTADINSLTPGKPADMILGQPDSTSSGVARSTEGFSNPRAISTYGGRLAVGDPSNYRVLVWNTVPTCSGTPACTAAFGTPNVLGQSNLTEVAKHAISDKAIGYSFGLAFTGLNQLVVNDNESNRFMIFNAP